MKQNLMEFGELPEMIFKNKFVLMKNVPFKRKAQSSQLVLHYFVDIFIKTSFILANSLSLN